MLKKSKCSINIFYIFIFLIFLSATCTDVHAKHWADEELKKADEIGLIDNYFGAEDFRADDNITRAEFMYFINRLKGYDLRSPKVADYYDVSPNDWYYDTVSVALAAGYIYGVSDNKMSPNRGIKREEAMTILTRVNAARNRHNAYRYANDGYTVSNWAKDSVSACIGEGYVTGYDGKINPHSYITRAEAVVMLNRVNSDTRVFSLPGEYDFDDRSVKNVEIYAPMINIKNLTVKENIKVKDGIEGKIILDKITIKNDLDIDSADIHADDLVADDIIIENASLTIKGKSEVDTIKILANSMVKNLAKDYKKVEDVIIDEEAEDERVDLLGEFYKVKNDADDVSLRADGEIYKLNLNEDIRIFGDVEVHHLSKDNNKIRVKIMDKHGDYNKLGDYAYSFTVDSGDYNEDADKDDDDEDDDDDDDSEDEEDYEDKYEKAARKFEKRHEDILDMSISSITLSDRLDIEDAIEDFDELDREARRKVERYYRRKLERLEARIKQLQE